MRTFLSPRKNSAHHVPSIAVSEPPERAGGQPAKGSSSNTNMAGAFGSKSRKVRFDLTLRIADLNNVPLVSGTSFVKWHLPSSTAAEHRGRTNKCAIREHRVAYNYEKRLPVRLTVGKDGMLQECRVEFEVLQEYSAGGRGERIELGNVRLNLAEYVDVGGDQPPSPDAAPRGDDGADDAGIVRRYLMQDSKINSTLKLGIHMVHTEGTRDYTAPPLRTAPVFGGIAGIIHSSEPAAGGPGGASTAHPAGPAAADDDTLPNLSTRNKELGEMQDMYRRTLAAFWASQPGELRADECIEDIFAGGDGWGSRTQQHATATATASQQHRHAREQPPGSGASTPRSAREADAAAEGVEVTGRGEARLHTAGKGVGMMEIPRRRAAKGGGARFAGLRRGQGEVDEFEVREDLRSWGIGQEAVG